MGAVSNKLLHFLMIWIHSNWQDPTTVCLSLCAWKQWKKKKRWNGLKAFFWLGFFLLEPNDWSRNPLFPFDWRFDWVERKRGRWRRRRETVSAMKLIWQILMRRSIQELCRSAVNGDLEDASEWVSAMMLIWQILMRWSMQGLSAFNGDLEDASGCDEWWRWRCGD